MHTTFDKIWRNNLWKHPHSCSGPGSTMDATAHVRVGLEKIIEDYDIWSILDTACGDFGWMSAVDTQGAKYLGMDIVPDLIAEVDAAYGRDDGSREFMVGDVTTSELPKADLVVARDVLGHLSYAHGLQALKNIRASGATWFLGTTFTARRGNHDIVDGMWRPVNLSAWPYNLGAPTAVIVEHCKAGNGIVKDKSLGLWPIARLSE